MNTKLQAVALGVMCALLTAPAWSSKWQIGSNGGSGIPQAPATNTTQDITFPGFGTVDCAKIIATYGDTDGTGAAGALLSIGFMDGTTSKTVVNSLADNVGTTSGSIKGLSSQVVEIVTAGTGTQVRAATAAKITDGIRLTWSGSNTAVRPRVQVTLYGGTGGCAVGSLVLPSSIGSTVSISGLGFNPNFAEFAWLGTATAFDGGTDTSQFRPSYGFAVNTSGIVQRAVEAIADDNVTTPNSFMEVVTNRVGGDAFSRSAEHTSWDTGGLTLTKRDATTARGLAYLVLNTSDTIKVGSVDAPATASADWNVTGVGWQPKFLNMITSLATSEGGGDDGISIGLFESDGTLESTIGVSDKKQSGVSNSDNQSLVASKLLLADMAGSTLFDGHALTFTSNGWNILDADLATASGTTRKWEYFAVQSSAVAPTITDVETTEIIQVGQTNVTITGTGFGASQGAGNVEICNSATHSGATCQSQTETSWGDTAVDFTVSRGSLSLGTNYVFVTENGGLLNTSGFAITLNDANPTFDTGMAFVSSTATTMTGSVDGSASAVTYYAGLFVPGACAGGLTPAQVKARTGAHSNAATGAATGSSQQIVITSSDARPWPYYDLAVVLENTGGLSAVSCVAGTYAATPMSPPSDELWVLVHGTHLSGGLIDDAGTTPDAVNDADVLSTTDTDKACGVMPFENGDWEILCSDSTRQIFSSYLWRLSDNTWDGPAQQVVNDHGPTGGPVLEGRRFYLVDAAITPIDLCAPLTDVEDDTLTCTTDMGSSWPTGLSISMNSLTGTPTVLGRTSTAWTASDGYGGAYHETEDLTIVDGLVPDVVGDDYVTAALALVESSYSAALSSECTNAVASGLVSRTSPASGAEADLGSTVIIYTAVWPCLSKPSLGGLGMQLGL